MPVVSLACIRSSSLAATGLLTVLGERIIIPSDLRPGEVSLFEIF
jgi:hypothetical protein